MTEKYIGRSVDMIYEDRSGKITMRRVRINDIRDGKVRGWAPRVFALERTVTRHVS